MQWTLLQDNDGKPVFNEQGEPVFITPEGKEHAINPGKILETIRSRNQEASQHRREKNELARQLKSFEGIDPQKARAALETLGMVDEGKLLDATRVEEMKQAATEEYRQKADGLAKSLARTQAAVQQVENEKNAIIHSLLVENAFTASPYLKDSTVLPPDVAYAAFGSRFTVEYENGTPMVQAKDNQGNILYSPANPERPATPEEAIKHFVESHPHRDMILKAASPKGGSGAKNGSSTGIRPPSLAACSTEAEKIAYLKHLAR